jgi:vanillate monooxygenase
MASQRAFPLNAWYAIAWDAELRHELFPRTVANKKIVLYRRSDGRPVALEDACWHRLLPLSKGRSLKATRWCAAITV